MSLRINPEYEKMLPRMSEEEFAQLKASIQSEGQHYSIIANDDLEVLDGHHRYRACMELGIEPDFEVRHFEDKLLEKKFVIEANLRRRHLNNFQLVELAVPLLEIEKALAKKRRTVKSQALSDEDEVQLGLTPDEFKLPTNGEVTENVAKKVGVSTRTFEKGKKILQEASEEEKQKLRDGKTSITRVYQEIVAPENADFEDSSNVEDRRAAMNKAALRALLKSLLEDKAFCPACGHNMLECSKCHKTLQESLGE
jgi:ParB-like chromosome segregation protein Spo0J